MKLEDLLIKIFTSMFFGFFVDSTGSHHCGGDHVWRAILDGFAVELFI